MDLGETYSAFSVEDALSKMSDKGWLTCTQGRAENKVLIKFYRLSALGVGVALAKNPEFKLLDTLETYRPMFPEFETLIQMASTLQPELATKFMRVIGQHLMRMAEKKDCSEESILKAISGLQALDKTELGKLVEVSDFNYAILERHFLKQQQPQQFVKEHKSGGLRGFLSRIF